MKASVFRRSFDTQPMDGVMRISGSNVFEGHRVAGIALNCVQDWRAP